MLMQQVVYRDDVDIMNWEIRNGGVAGRPLQEDRKSIHNKIHLGGNLSEKDDIIFVIDRTATIENLLDQIIEKYCSPRKEVFSFFWSVVLDSSILSLGAKVKLVTVIAQELGVQFKSHSLHQILSLRNAFAHHPSTAHPVLAVGVKPDQDEVYYELHVISNSGKIRKVERGKALKEFNNNYDKAKQSLNQLLEAVKDSLQH